MSDTDRRIWVKGLCELWHDKEGWGVVVGEDLLGDVWLPWSVVEAAGYRHMEAGDPVEFQWQTLPEGQHGYARRVTRLRPLGRA